MKSLFSFRLTRAEKNWVLYDVGNSAFILLVSTIIPIYFDYLAEQGGLSSVDYLSFWGYAASISTLIVALIGPVAGTLADYRNFKKPVFVVSLAVGCIGCLLLGLAQQWLIFLIIFVIAKVGYSTSLIFYDSMLGDITTPDRMDNVSSHGYAWRYIGSCVPFIICLGVVLTTGQTGLSMSTAMLIAFVIVALWWAGNSVPLLKIYQQKHWVERKPGSASNSFKRLGRTLVGLRKEKHILLFLIAFFFYIDGVYTIIEMATAYGSALGLDSTGILLALLVTQFVAFPCSIIFGRLSQKFASDKLITVCILAYFGIAVFAIFMSRQLHFWILAVAVGMFQGGVQALSRSWFAKIVPAEKSGEYFGLMDICGKGASFFGTGLVSIISSATGDINLGVGMIAVLFIIGLVVFRVAVTYTPGVGNKQK